MQHDLTLEQFEDLLDVFQEPIGNIWKVETPANINLEGDWMNSLSVCHIQNRSDDHFNLFYH